MPKGKKVAVGLSGGVDSAVAAALLVAEGYEVTGVFIEAYNEPGCRTDQDRQDALQVAMRLGVRFQTLDVRKQYREKVVQYFINEYKAGRTPNPDIVCNAEIKFGLFYDWTRGKEFDYLATGHYARISPEGYLQRPRDLGKDQSYFLWRVNPRKLDNLLFPLGEMTKQEVRAKAKELGLPNADKPDSMGVCMMGELNLKEFLRGKLGVEPGEVVWKGRVVGKHLGLWFSTIGQRGGWEINSKIKTQKSKLDLANLPGLYVIGKNMRKNQLIVGTREEAYFSEIKIQNLEFRITKELVKDLVEKKKLFVRLRNLGELYLVKELGMRKQEGEIRTKEAVFAPAPGQSAVLYARIGKTGEEVIVGGALVGACKNEKNHS
jgi:tRNA-specific 2-thiouridylase